MGKDSVQPVISGWQIGMRILIIQRKWRVMELRHPVPPPKLLEITGHVEPTQCNQILHLCTLSSNQLLGAIGHSAQVAPFSTPSSSSWSCTSPRDISDIVLFLERSVTAGDVARRVCGVALREGDISEWLDGSFVI